MACGNPYHDKVLQHVRMFYLFAMVTQSEQYRQRTKEAEQNAEKARDAEAKAAWLKLAKGWRELADQVERNDW
jgi:hypothetical protein